MFPEFIEKYTQEVEGGNADHEVTIFTLSTCMWCKKCKKYLKDKEIKYKYIDVDKIDPGEKSKILQYLRETYKPNRVAYPFVVCDDKFVVGYDPNKMEEMLTEGGT